MSSYLNLKVLVRKVEKNHSGISKLSHLFLKTLKLNTLLSPNHYLFEFLQDRERLNQLANFDQIFLQTSRKPIFQKICYESRSDIYLPGDALPWFSNIFLPFKLLCRMPRHVEIPATASLSSRQKNPRKPKNHSSHCESSGHGRGNMMGRLESVCILGFFCLAQRCGGIQQRKPQRLRARALAAGKAASRGKSCHRWTRMIKSRQ